MDDVCGASHLVPKQLSSGKGMTAFLVITKKWGDSIGISQKIFGVDLTGKSMSEANAERNAAIRSTMMPRDTNAYGTVFGGVILSHIDVAGMVEAVRRTGHERFVTIAMREVRFHEPVFVGDLVSFYAETLKIGQTSITTRVVVDAERFGRCGQLVRVTEEEVVYIAINQNREKVNIHARASTQNIATDVHSKAQHS